MRSTNQFPMSFSHHSSSSTINGMTDSCLTHAPFTLLFSRIVQFLLSFIYVLSVISNIYLYVFFFKLYAHLIKKYANIFQERIFSYLIEKCYHLFCKLGHLASSLLVASIECKPDSINQSISLTFTHIQLP